MTRDEQIELGKDWERQQAEFGERENKWLCRIDELEAQCAAMREALARAKGSGRLEDVVEIQCRNALAPDAGRTLLDRLQKAEADCEMWRTHAAESDKEFLQLEDWLIGNAEFDPKLGLIHRAEKCRERIRDLVAAEGERNALREVADKMAKALEIVPLGQRAVLNSLVGAMDLLTEYRRLTQ